MVQEEWNNQPNKKQTEPNFPANLEKPHWDDTKRNWGSARSESSLSPPVVYFPVALASAQPAQEVDGKGEIWLEGGQL